MNHTLMEGVLFEQHEVAQNSRAVFSKMPYEVLLKFEIPLQLVEFADVNIWWKQPFRPIITQRWHVPTSPL